MKFGTCEKCGKQSWLEEHHILPRSTFGENDQKIDLCPNCHTDYHQKLGSKGRKNPDMAFHFYFFDRWLYGLIGVMLLLVYLFF
jgi:hypothetical protein